MQKRTLKTWAAANRCDTCKAQGVFTPATHSTTDSQQTEDGWKETLPRFGCRQHAVAPNVILFDGAVMPLEVYRAN